MRALEIVAGSWPFAVMFVALCAALVARRIINSIREDSREDKAYRASQALVVPTTGSGVRRPHADD